MAQPSPPSRRITHCCLNSALKERRITAYGLAHRSEIATFMHAEGVREIPGQKLK